MEQSKDYRAIPMTSFSSGNITEVKKNVWYYTDQIVNVVIIGNADNWVLIDAGMPNSGKELDQVATELFGVNSKPKAIVLTHGHFDHVGGLVYLLDKWKVPVFAHPKEIPFLDGTSAYPEPDSSVAGGLLAKISFIYPHQPTNVSEYIQPLPPDGTIPYLNDWQYIETPGHSPGHIFFVQSGRQIADQWRRYCYGQTRCIFLRCFCK